MMNLKVLGSWDAVDQDHRNRASNRVRGVLARRVEEVDQVIVRLGESLRLGGQPVPECRMLVRRQDGRTLRANARARTLEEAIDRAAARLKAAWDAEPAPEQARAPAWASSGAAT